MNAPAPPSQTALARASCSAVFISAEDDALDASLVREISEILAQRFVDSEIVIVGNGSTDRAALALKKLAETIPDLSVHFLAQRVDRDSAFLVGMENAIGDFVLLIEPRPELMPELIQALPALFAGAAAGYDVTLARARDAQHGAGALEAMFVSLYNALTRGAVLRERPPLRLYSRAASLHILQSVGAEMLLRSERIAGGFPALMLQEPLIDEARVRARGGAWSAREPGRGFSQSMSKGIRLLLSATSAPLRLVTVAGLLGSATALAYSVYVVCVYLFSPFVQPGWTTLSLQLSLMMFMFSAMFALLAEYVVLIHRSSGARRRPIVAREVRSQASRRAGRLNVVDNAGRFQLGAPKE